MVVMRLSRCGTKHKPRYRVRVADRRRSPTGKFIETIGFYDSLSKEPKGAFQVDIEKYKKWLSCGAKPSQTLRNLIKKNYSI